MTKDKTISNLYYLLTCVLFLFLLIIPVQGYTIQLYPVMDGTIARTLTGAGGNMTYNNASMQAGNTISLTSTTGIIGAYTSTGTISNNFSSVTRNYYTFDLSGIPLDATINSAYFRFVPSAKTVTLGTPALTIAKFTPDNKLTYIAGDYNKTPLIPLGSYIESSSITAGYENFIPLNTAGITLIEQSRISKYISLSLLTNWDINQTPNDLLWGVSRSAIYTTYLSEQIDTINDPYLIIAYQFGSANNNIYTNVSMNNEQQELFYHFLNQYILIIVILIIYALSMYTQPFLAFIGFIVSYIGLVTTMNFSFEFGTIFVLLMVAGFFIGVRGD